MKKFFFLLWWFCIWLPVVSSGDSGRTNAEGCQVTGEGSHQCHDTHSDPLDHPNGLPDRPLSEDDYNALFCASVGGQTETRHEYEYPVGHSFVKIDCETEEHVYEGGLDKRSSLDSVQQALFFSFLTGKAPAVVIYDRDGRVGRFEYRIQTACERAGVRYISFP